MHELFADAEFWVAVAFVIFWGIMFYYGVPGKVLNQLDSRGTRIANELAEAKRLREDAELRAQVDGWFEAPAKRPQGVEPGDWLRWEQEKHQRLLALADVA